MALPVLDGNQSATTLSSVVTGGEHIVAHSVVCFGSTAISNITNAVSGIVVSISNFPSTQTIAGTVTANVVSFSDIIGNSTSYEGNPQPGFNGVFVLGRDWDSDSAKTLNTDAAGQLRIAPISGTVTANVNKVGYDGGNDTNYFPIAFVDSPGGSLIQVSQDPNGGLPISGTVTVGNSVTIGSLPAISGTVTANLNGYSQTAVSYSGSSVTAIPVVLQTNGVYGGTLLAYNGANTYLRVGLDAVGGNSLAFGGSVPVSGTVTIGNSVTIGSLPTVAPQLPRVTFIDGSGTVTTANTAITIFASSSTRSYLLVQVTTGSAFVNVGATATTVNGINLTAGQGYAWETTIPQGIVSLISTTTSSRWVAKEA